MQLSPSAIRAIRPASKCPQGQKRFAEASHRALRGNSTSPAASDDIQSSSR